MGSDDRGRESIVAMTKEQQEAIERASQRVRKKRGVLGIASDVAAEINEGIISSLPIPGARGVLHRAGIGSQENDPSVADSGLRMIGASVPLAVGGAAALTARSALAPLGAAQQASGVKGGLERIAQMVVDAYRNNPGAFIAAETAGAFGAGAGAEVGKEFGPSAQAAGGFIGGAAAGVAPAVLANRGANALRSTIETVAPFTDTGGRLRAGKQMQARAADPDAAAIAAQSGRPGVTPARRTGEDRLIAQEEFILSSGDPSLARRVQEDLIAAQQAVQRDITDSFGSPMSPTEWRRAVIQKVAPDGVTVSLADTDKMLSQAYRGFDAAYAPARGHPIPIGDLGKDISKAIASPDVFAGDVARKTTRAWVNSQLQGMLKRAEGGTANSDDLLELRSAIRNRQRMLAKHSDADSDQARELLDSVEYAITSRIESGLPSDSLVALQAADSRYRMYKVVEDAVYRSGDVQLTPQKLSSAIRINSEQRGLYARGKQDELRSLARSGKDISTVLGNPDEARLMVRDVQDKKPIHAAFVRAIADKARSSDDAGNAVISGAKLKSLMREQGDVAKALGMSDKDMQRLSRLADELIMMQKKPDASVAQLFEDGPANIAQLGAALIGAKSGQRMAGNGLGSSLVLAGFMSRKAKDTLGRLTSDRAEKLMIDAVTDPKLFAALLTGPTSTPRKRRDAARAINAWVVMNYPDDEHEATFSDQQRAAIESAKLRIENR